MNVIKTLLISSLILSMSPSVCNGGYSSQKIGTNLGPAQDLDEVDLTYNPPLQALRYEYMDYHLSGPRKFVLSRLPMNVNISGYVMNNYFFDTRQIRGFQANDIMLFPLEQILDPNGQDINAHGSFNALPIETDIRIDIAGPDISCGKTNAAIEVNFFGQNELNINMIRMLHAYFEIDWPRVTLLIGQTYHPIYFPAKYPDTVAFSYGGPIAPYADVPQFRATYHSDSIGDLLFAAISELNIPNVGPAGFEGPAGFSTSYFRNSMMPKFHLQLRSPIGEHFLGFGLDIKRIVPRLVTSTGYKAHESLVSGAGIAYFEFHSGRINGAIKATIAQNANDYAMTGGYAVSSVEPVTDHRTYTNFNVLGAYLDIERSGKIEPGLFVGVLKSLGASNRVIQEVIVDDIIEPTLYGDGQRIDTIFRISPRIRYHHDPVVFCAELEATRAAHGHLGTFGKVFDTIPTTNVRFIMSVYYFF